MSTFLSSVTSPLSGAPECILSSRNRQKGSPPTSGARGPSSPLARLEKLSEALGGAYRPHGEEAKEVVAKGSCPWRHELLRDYGSSGQN